MGSQSPVPFFESSKIWLGLETVMKAVRVIVD